VTVGVVGINAGSPLAVEENWVSGSFSLSPTYRAIALTPSCVNTRRDHGSSASCRGGMLGFAASSPTYRA